MDFLEQVFDPATADIGAEELGRQVGDLMGLVEDDRVGGTEDITEAVLLQRKVRQQEMMVDDDNVSIEELRGVLTRRDNVRSRGSGCQDSCHVLR